MNLFTGTLNAFTDLLIRGAVELPTANTRFRYELVRENGQVIPLAPEQALEFGELIDEVVTLRAVMNGTMRESPILWSGTTLIAGRVRNSGDYITKAWPIRGASRATAVFAQQLPRGPRLRLKWTSLTAIGCRSLSLRAQTLAAAGKSLFSGRTS